MVSRRKFIKFIPVIGLTPFAWIWVKSIERNYTITNLVTEINYDIAIATEITYADKFIIIKQNQNISIFSSECTHLGCRIDKFENNMLICPCHGSKFDLNGTVISGPAVKPLKKIEYSFNKSNHLIRINEK